LIPQIDQSPAPQSSKKAQKGLTLSMLQTK